MNFSKRFFFIGLSAIMAISVARCRETNEDAKKPAEMEDKEGVKEQGNELMEKEKERTTSPYPMDNTDSIPKDSAN
ncbi:hypothetical protein RQM65_02275 [Pricia sp. S334]|uniref:Lipoprotein n=1 Tax=Pricia mediterranea TaxID=3076079 RepID=A0ABU3L185_9FLAO|nr:hypothetical protein [Pricia sp. S334]MDT7827489.1 hypothetical protein [Pricia sp. S334]